MTFAIPKDLDGLFSGWDAENKKYDPESWFLQRLSTKGQQPDTPGHKEIEGGHRRTGAEKRRTLLNLNSDPTMENPRCVFQVLKRHFARYTPENRGALLRSAKGSVSKSRGNLYFGVRAREDWRDLLLRWDGHNTQKGCRSFGQPQFCNCCWEIWTAWRRILALRVMRPSRGRPTFHAL